MSKDPAFLFYPNDYIGGTMGMTFEEKGAYMELLMMQFNRGHMTTHMIGQTVGQLWDKIEVKFKEDAKGLWYNVRLEEEQVKRQEFTKSRCNNVLGTNQHSNKTKKEIGHMTTRMENEDVNEDVNVKEKEPTYKTFYREEWEKSKDSPFMAQKYQHIVKYLMNVDKNIIDEPGEHILKLKKQLSFDDFLKLTEYCRKRQTTIKDMIDSWLNKPDYSKGRVSVYAVLQTWARKSPMAGTNFQEPKTDIIPGTSIGK